MIRLAAATLRGSEIDEIHAVCRSNPAYWRYSGDLDPDDIAREAVAAMFREQTEVDGSEVLVARDVAGRLVGVAVVLRRHPVDGHPWIGFLMVDGRLRRRGHGRAIAGVIETRFRGAGAPGLRLGILENNVEARRFWTALGYREIDRRPDRAKGRPTLVMHKDLRA